MSDLRLVDLKALKPDSPGTSGTPDVSPFAYWETPVEPGRTLVEASAGTGKTFAIAGLVLRLVLEGPWLDDDRGAPDLRRLLVVTFTNAATEELKTRIRAALRTALGVARDGAEPDDLTRPLGPLLQRAEAPDRLLAALDRVDEAGIFTIHGFCKRVLEQAAFESGTPFDLEFVEDADSAALRRRAAADAWARLVHGDALLAALALDKKRTPDELIRHHQAISDFPHVEIRPSEPDFAAARGALDAAHAELARAWDRDAAEEALKSLEWNGGTPLSDDARAATLARVGAFAAGRDPDGWAAVRACTPEGIYKAGRKHGDARKQALKGAGEHAAFRACEAVAQAADALDLAFVRTFIEEIGARTEAIKARRGQVTFNDLITQLHDALHHASTGPALARGIRDQFAVALIDEFQDTDPLQYALFRTAFEGCPLYFVGDPKQAIYAFRGADVHAYLGAQREAHRRFTLGTNWRSTAGLVDAVNRVFAHPRRAFLFDGIPFRPVQAAPHRTTPKLVDEGGPATPLVWWPMPTADEGRTLGKTSVQKELPALVAAEVRRLLTDARMRTSLKGEGEDATRPLGASDVAVLVPDRYAAADILRALQALKIPAVVSRADDVRKSREMGETELLLRAVLRPDDERALRAALATELWGWSADQIAALDHDSSEAARLLGQVRAWHKAWRRHGVLHVLTDFQHTQNVLARLLAYPDGERRVTNLRHTAELLHELESGGGRSPEDLAHWLRHRDDQPLGDERKQLRLERDADAVTITTHHNAKGLEFEVVFLPYLWSISERDYTIQSETLARTDDGVVYDLGSDRQAEVERLRQVDTLAEHVRKAYVALTRARERCYVVWGAVKSRSKRLDPLSGLGYLLAGHDADGLDTDLAAHVEAARTRANLDRPLDPVRALDPEGTVSALADPPGPTPPLERAAPDPGPLAPRALPDEAHTRVRTPWKAASFTAWSAGGDGHLAASDEPDAPRARETTVPEGLHAFAAGAGPGTCLHQILQHAEWEDRRDGGPDDEERRARTRATIERRLTGHGLARRRAHRAPIDPAAEVEALLDRVAAAPLFRGPEGEPLTMADADRRAEWPFAFPLGRVAPAALADAFSTHGTDPFGPAYADALARLSRDAVDGLMTGEVDLVARAGDRWWIVDWKSNRLGADASAYTPEALQATMTEHHYGLQLHLYTLALHRFLRTRLGAAYAYETHIGGAVYAFLRGLDDAGSEAGLFAHRPSAELIEALDALLVPATADDRPPTAA